MPPDNATRRGPQGSMITTATELRAIEQTAAHAQPALPVGEAKPLRMIDWAAAQHGDRAMCAAMEAWLAEVPMTWLTTQDWL